MSLSSFHRPFPFFQINHKPKTKQAFVLYNDFNKRRPCHNTLEVKSTNKF